MKVIYWLVAKLGQATCYRCGEAIESELELSIDHKEAWLDAGVEKYWDMENIAFSHKLCNYVEHRKNPDRSKHAEKFRKQGPPGTAWCGIHRRFLPVSAFSLNSHRWNGLADVCKDCRSKRRSPKTHP